MTAVAVPAPDLLRRLVIPVAVLLALLLPASAHALTYCVKPAANPVCAATFPTVDKAMAAADKQKGDDQVIRQAGNGTVTIPLPDKTADPIPTPKIEGPSVFDDITNFMLTWLPLIFMGIICL